MFAVTFGIWIKCEDGELDYGRLAELPFVPYPGLEIEDDAFGEFNCSKSGGAARSNASIASRPSPYSSHTRSSG